MFLCMLLQIVKIVVLFQTERVGATVADFWGPQELLTFPMILQDVPNCPADWFDSFDKKKQVVCFFHKQMYLYNLQTKKLCVGKDPRKVGKLKTTVPDPKPCTQEDSTGQSNKDALGKNTFVSTDKKQDLNPCGSNPCKDHGTCVDLKDGQYLCKCQIGKNPDKDCDSCRNIWRWGEDCKYECLGCSSHTALVEFGKESPCHEARGCTKCLPGIQKPPKCDKVNCKVVICRHEAKCKNGRCVCPFGYTGILCESDLDDVPECSTLSTSMRKPQDSETMCRQKQTCFIVTKNLKKRCQTDCESQVKDPCPIHGAMVCASNTCENGGTCLKLKDGRNICRCLPQWAGKTCSDSCVSGSENCLHGLCVEGKCICRRGYWGERCVDECRVGTFGLSPGMTKADSGKCTDCGNCMFFPCDFQTGDCEKKPGKQLCQDFYLPDECIIWDKFGKGNNKIPIKGAFNLFGEWKPSLLDENSKEYNQLSNDTRFFVRQSAGRVIPRGKKKEVQVSQIRFQNTATKVRELRNRDVYKQGEAAKDRARRQKAGPSAGVGVDFTLILPSSETSDEKFTQRLTSSMKERVNEFKAGDYKIDVNSIQTEKEKISTRIVDNSSTSKTDSTTSPTIVYISLVAVVAVLLIATLLAAVKLVKGPGRIAGRQPYKQTGRTMRHYPDVQYPNYQVYQTASVK